MSGIIGANNQFGHDFNSPDSSLQGTIVSLYDVSTSLSLSLRCDDINLDADWLRSGVSTLRRFWGAIWSEKSNFCWRFNHDHR
jgi:hypothetical protein